MGDVESQLKYVTESELGTIANYTNHVPLSGKQKDQIMKIWVESSAVERRIISRLYQRLFADAGFIPKLQALISQREIKSGSAGDAANIEESGPQIREQILMLRKSVENAVAKLVGPGPFKIEFGLVTDEATNQEVIELFNSQFVNPELSALQKMLTVPKKISTRSRQTTGGNLTWFIRSVNNNGEIACAVSCHVHTTHSAMRFIEVPLFATKPGYLKMGLGRLLTAALKDLCVQEGMHYLLVSADQKAVPFWSGLGFVKLELALRNRIDQDDCYDFKGSEVMRWKVPDPSDVRGVDPDSSNDDEPINTNDEGYESEENDNAKAEDDEAAKAANVIESLQRMDKFLIKGSLLLPKLTASFGTK